MPTLGVVKAFQVAEDAGFGLLTGLVICALDLLGFERCEERLDHCVVVTVTAARHTLGDVIGVQLGSKSIAGVLGEFNRSSQHVSEVMIADCRVLLQASSKQAFF